MARAHIRSCIIDARCGVFDFIRFHNVLLIKYTVQHLLVVCVSFAFSMPLNWHGWGLFILLALASNKVNKL